MPGGIMFAESPGQSAGAPPKDRRRIRQALALLAVAAFHALIIYVFVFNFFERASPTSLSSPPVEVHIIDLPDPLRSAHDIPAPKQVRLQPASPKIIVPDVSIVLPPDIPRIASPRTSSAPSTSPSAGASLTNGTGTGGRQVLTQVTPDYANLRRDARGTTVVRALVGRNGRVDKVKIVKGSGSWQLDQAVVHAVHQWRFAPSANPSDVGPLAFSCCVDLAGIFSGTMTLYTFNAILAAELQTWALPVSGPGGKSPGNEEEIYRLIERVQTGVEEQGTHHTNAPPDLLATWGQVQSVAFITDESRGLPIDTAAGKAVGSRADAQMRWRLYGVRQAKGTFIWLAGVNQRGAITVLEGMACVNLCLRLPAASVPTAASQ